MSAPLRSTAPLALFALGLAAAPADSHAQIKYPGVWGDHGDGTYANPVIAADFSDLDAIRVGDTFVAISSTMQFSPGMAVLTSRDLVNWTLVGHAVPDPTQISSELNWDRMNRYGFGVWAGAIRHHAGLYHVYFGTPQEGYFMTTAPAPEGPWSPLVHLHQEEGWDDCCPFWDDDRQGYLVGTRFVTDPANGKKYNVYLWKLTPDGRALEPGSARIIHQSQGSEANKLYKINGLYYHYYSEVKPEGRVVMMRRARSLEGPWETRQLNHAVPAPRVDPNQGGLIELPDKSWWFFTHMGSGTWAGRMAHLLPVTWIDGWPVPGEVGADGIGNMVWHGKKPILGEKPAPRLFTETFSSRQLAPAWEWNHHPRADKWSLGERRGWLRLHAFKPLQPDTIHKTGNTLTQRIHASASGLVTVRLDSSRLADGQNAGLVFFGRHAGWIGVVRQSGETRVIQVEQDRRHPGPVLTDKDIWLRAHHDIEGRVTFSYSTDGRAFTELGETHQATWSHYRGTRIGLFTYNNDGEAGSVDFDDFVYRY